MTTTPHSVSPFAALALAAAFLGSCGQSEPEFAPERGGRAVATEQPAAEDATQPSADPAPSRDEPATEPEPTPVATDDGRIPDHVRERPLVEDLGSRSSLGRTRDSAKDLRNSLQGGLDTSPLAITSREDEYVQIANIHWDLPEGWRIAVPQDPDVLEEVVVPSATYGSGRILFMRSDGSYDEQVRDWEGRMLDGVGSPVDAISDPYDAGDYAGQAFTMRGTYVADGREHPFFMIAIIGIDLEDGTSVTGVYIAPEDTQLENRAKWEQFLDSVKIK